MINGAPYFAPYFRKNTHRIAAQLERVMKSRTWPLAKSELAEAHATNCLTREHLRQEEKKQTSRPAHGHARCLEIIDASRIASSSSSSAAT